MVEETSFLSTNVSLHFHQVLIDMGENLIHIFRRILFDFQEIEHCFEAI
jgi:hypothetical protein